MQSAYSSGWFRISLRELFLLVAWAAMGCTALKTAGNVWMIILWTIALMMVMGLAVVAIVDRESRQAFAMGFLIWALIYGYLVTSNQNANVGHSRELDPYEGQLPTTKAMFPLFEGLATRKWHDFNTGKEVPNYDPSNPANNPFSMSQPYVSESPARQDFMKVAHLLWSLLLGYVGGRFAQWVYRRRISREQSGSQRHRTDQVV